jgi:hypothetical protein
VRPLDTDGYGIGSSDWTRTRTLGRHLVCTFFNLQIDLALLASAYTGKKNIAHIRVVVINAAAVITLAFAFRCIFFLIHVVTESLGLVYSA